MDAATLKVIVWPALVLLIVVLLLLVPSTRASIGGLLGRVTKVGLGGLEAAQAQTSTAKPATPSQHDGNAADPLLEPIVQRYRAWLDANIKEPGQREDAALRHAARQEIWIWHEWRYRMIFGSQLKLVEAVSGAGSLAVAEARKLYDAGKASAPQVYGTYSFEQWLQWLAQYGLVLYDAASVRASPLTRDFLVWMDTMRLPRQKPG